MKRTTFLGLAAALMLLFAAQSPLCAQNTEPQCFLEAGLGWSNYDGANGAANSIFLARSFDTPTIGLDLLLGLQTSATVQNEQPTHSPDTYFIPSRSTFTLAVGGRVRKCIGGGMELFAAALIHAGGMLSYDMLPAAEGGSYGRTVFPVEGQLGLMYALGSRTRIGAYYGLEYGIFDTGKLRSNAGLKCSVALQ